MSDTVVNITPWSGLPNGLPVFVPIQGTTNGNGTVVQIINPNPYQRGYMIYAVDGDLWVNILGGDAAPDTAGSFKVGQGCIYESPFAGASPLGVSICDTSTGTGVQYTGISF